MTSTLNKNQKGFTIIEVLIVLAIAGLIVLIVFLAVPSLQRNSRNTQRKNDVSQLLGAVTEFSNNNNGRIPTSTGDQATAASNATLGYYDAVAWGAGIQSAITGDTVRIVTAAKCGTSGATVAGSARQIAIQYMNEGSGGLVPTCQSS